MAGRVRISALAELLAPSLRWAAAKAAENALQIAVGAVIAILAGLFGITIPTFG